MATLKVKDIHIALKRNDSIDYLMERFTISSKEELFEDIRRIAPARSEEFIRKLEKKQKFIDRRERNNGHETADKDEGLKEEQPVQESEEEDFVEDEEDVTTDEIEQEDDNMPAVLDMEMLKAQEQELSAMLCQLEGQHKEFVTKRRELNACLCKAVKALKELYRLAEVQEQNVTNLYEEYQQCADQMNAINQEKRSCEELLEEVRGRISELNKVTIMVYQNGNIEVENAEIPSISEEEINAEFLRLISMPGVGKITVDELKAIAKLLKMVKVYESSKCPFELEFDSTEVQRLWETVTA